LTGDFHLGHAQCDARCAQDFVHFGQNVGRAHIHAGDRFRRDDQPAPAASAAGVRDELLLIAKPWKKSAARLATPVSGEMN
jgi:hypothetical protein